MARLRARTYAYLIGIGTPILLAGVLWWFRRQGGQAAPSDQLFALVIGAAMLGTAGILLKRSLPTLGASLALLVLGFPQEVLGMVILPSGGLYLIAAFIVGLTDIGDMVGEGIEAGREGMEESGMNAPEMPSAFQDATDGGETETADTPENARPEAASLDPPEQSVPDAEAPDGPEQPVDAADVDPITTEDGVDATEDEVAAEDETDSTATETDTDETVPDPEDVVEEHGPHHAPEVQVDQTRVHADDPSVGQIGGDDEVTDSEDVDETTDDEDVDETTDDEDVDETTDDEDVDETTDDEDVDETTDDEDSPGDVESREPTGDRGTRAERPDPDEARDWGGHSEASADEAAPDADEMDDPATEDPTAATGASDEQREDGEPPGEDADADSESAPDDGDETPAEDRERSS
ncbi:hypothetical protein ACFPJ5_12365 [Salinirubrum litoreum]|uniref:Uncharacterized protein n=1 Tax=Salinirubrum litoreum TaxID=1126234 RepID=A0ABD5RD45_9EURY